MAKKTPRGLVALSASAIAVIYAAGYLATQPVAANATPTNEAAAAVVSSSPPAPSVVTTAPTSVPPVAATPTSQPTAGAAPTSQTVTAAAYRDGSYQGTGTSRFGDVTVTVTVQGGRISGVALTRVTTKYPASRIAGLPAQVVARQSAQVDRVTGATYSTQAFQGAVQQALSQARSGGTAVGA